MNKKIPYFSKEREKAEFIPLGNSNLTKIMCIKVNRTILIGSMISLNNEYGIPIDNNGNGFIFYKGTIVKIGKMYLTKILEYLKIIKYIILEKTKN